MAVSRLSSANLAVVGKSDRPEAPKGLLWAASSLTDLHNLCFDILSRKFRLLRAMSSLFSA